MYCELVPSILHDADVIIKSPIFISFFSAPVVPTLMNVSAPMLKSSSITIAAAGAPIPVDVHEIGALLYFLSFLPHGGYFSHPGRVARQQYILRDFARG